MIPMSSLSIDDFHSMTDAQLEALEKRLVAKYGKAAKSSSSSGQEDCPRAQDGWGE
jgi:hypothetical protein